MFFADERIKINRAVSEWCLRKAARNTKRERTEEALQWLLLAARNMSCECASLVSPELEKQLLEIGLGLAMPARALAPTGSPRRWLHVLTEVREDGGHSAMLQRWIQLDPRQNVHSIALLSQTVPLPSLLTDLISSKNGEIYQMDHTKSLTARAGLLRQIVMSHADVVVLHTHPWDILPTVALALPGGPPVLLVNHAAHIFWVGASVADIVLNCRFSPQEDEWTIRHRGVPSIMHLPIPLPEPENVARGVEEVRNATRKTLNIPLNAPLMLSVGIGNKYTPFDGVDFMQVMGDLLDADPRAYLVVIGPGSDARWENLRKRSGGRFILVEKQPGWAMPAYFQAADIYLEGFPFGSTTACLEAALRGLPCVLPPAGCPPPFTTDGVAMEQVWRAPDLAGYQEHVLRLLNDPAERATCGERLAGTVRAHHCGTGWSGYLAEIQKAVPEVHHVRPLNSTPAVSEHLSAYWTSFSAMINEDPLTSTFRTARYFGLAPKIDGILFLALLRHGRRGRKNDVPSCWKLAADSCTSCLSGLSRLILRKLAAGCHAVATLFQGADEKCPIEK